MTSVQKGKEKQDKKAKPQPAEIMVEKNHGLNQIGNENQSKTPTAYSGIKRSISDQDLGNPAVARLMLDEIYNLRDENRDLEQFRNKYYESQIDCAVLDSKVKSETKFQILYTFCLTIGGLIVGLAPSTTGDVKNQLFGGGFILIIIGALLSFLMNKK